LPFDFLDPLPEPRLDMLEGRSLGKNRQHGPAGGNRRARMRQIGQLPPRQRAGLFKAPLRKIRPDANILPRE
jgi:hypothetical protein